jgi:hypothetical protein
LGGRLLFRAQLRKSAQHFRFACVKQLCGESISDLENEFGRGKYEHLAQKDFRISSGVDRNFRFRGSDRDFHFRGSGACRAAREAASSPTPPPAATSPINRLGDICVAGGSQTRRHDCTLVAEISGRQELQSSK